MLAKLKINFFKSLFILFFVKYVFRVNKINNKNLSHTVYPLPLSDNQSVKVGCKYIACKM